MDIAAYPNYLVNSSNAQAPCLELPPPGVKKVNEVVLIHPAPKRGRYGTVSTPVLSNEVHQRSSGSVFGAASNGDRKRARACTYSRSMRRCS